ncbi:MAG: URC4/urg3 family protein [Myxococcales bacterium]
MSEVGVAVDGAAAARELGAGRAIRERTGNIFEAGLRGELTHFAVDMARLDEVARETADLTRRRFPSLEIPAHSRFGHFDAGGVPRLARVERALGELAPKERARALLDVVVASVLLDAGAGMAWRFREAETGLALGRSEGLAVASLVWLERGGLSSRGRPFEVDAAGLAAVDERALADAFQVSVDNPLVGMAGRVALLRALGRAVSSSPIFAGQARPGGLVDHLWSKADQGVLPAESILSAVLEGLGGIWPGRLSLGGVPLGDVWRHPRAGGQGLTAGLVPFHKLSQWLSYSLLHPLRVSGLEVVDLDALTGLAEYRNGGLFVDAGVLLPKHPGVLSEAHEVGSELVVEWRALTVALLDRVAPLVRAALGVPAERLPLAAVLEGGTWALGREFAARRRSDGGPPIRVLSDGTVF